MVKDPESIRRQLLEELVEAGELYLNLGEYIKAHKMTKIPRGKNRQNIIEPQLDDIIMKRDIWDKIKELAQKIPFI